MLKAFSVNAFSDGESLFIEGGAPTCGEIDSFNDHRIVMSASVLASGCDGESKIYNAHAVNKSYPTFFVDYKKSIIFIEFWCFSVNGGENFRIKIWVIF